MNRYIADLHFDHANILAFDRRPFFDVQEMNEALIANWNSVVQSGDTTYILGDFCWGKEERWLQLLPRLAGKKVLVRGNHDLKSMSADCQAHFIQVCDYKELNDAGRHVILCHYPMLFYNKAYNPKTYMLCGHVHNTQDNLLLEQWRGELWSALETASFPA